MTKKTLRQSKSGHDVIRYCAKQPRTTIAEAKGSHVKVKTPLGTVIVPDHRTDLHPGLRFAILKQLAAIGITIFILGAILFTLYA